MPEAGASRGTVLVLSTLTALWFLVLAVLPTLSTLAWTGYRVSPWYADLQRRTWEARLFAKPPD